MSDLPIKKDKNQIEKQAKRDIQTLMPDLVGFPFFTFRYSERSVISSGDQTHVKARELNYRHGKIEEKEFEGTMPGSYFDSIEKGLQQQTEFFLNSIKLFLPF